MQHTAVTHVFRNTLTIVGLVFAFVIVPLATGTVGSQAQVEQTDGDRAASFGQAVTAAFPTAEAGFVAVEARDRR